MSNNDLGMKTFLNALLPKAVNLSQLTVNVVLVLASFIAVIQYFTVRQENRIEQTMKQVTIFNETELIKARLVLTKWEKNTNKFIKEKINSETVQSENEKEEIKNRIEHLSLGDMPPEVYESAILILNFFANLQICVQNGICDKHVSGEFFCRFALNLNDQYQPKFKYEDEENTKYAINLLEEFLLLEECKHMI